MLDVEFELPSMSEEEKSGKKLIITPEFVDGKINFGELLK